MFQSVPYFLLLSTESATDPKYSTIIMCSRIFKLRRAKSSRRAPPLTLTHYPLALIDNERSSNQSPPLDPKETSSPQAAIGHVPLSAGDPDQRSPLSAIGIEQINCVANSQLPAPGATVHRPATGILLASGDAPVQDDLPAARVLFANDSIVHPEFWYCHVCHNGPQSIANHASCVGTTLTGGVCGHAKCHLCRTEQSVQPRLECAGKML